MFDKHLKNTCAKCGAFIQRVMIFLLSHRTSRGGVILENPMDGVEGGVLLENPMDGVGGGVLLETSWME